MVLPQLYQYLQIFFFVAFFVVFKESHKSQDGFFLVLHERRMRERIYALTKISSDSPSEPRGTEAGVYLEQS